MAFASAQDTAQLSCVVRVSEAGDDSVLLEVLAAVLAAGAKSLMILACGANHHSPHYLNFFFA